LGEIVAAGHPFGNAGCYAHVLGALSYAGIWVKARSGGALV
jgi:hypothetical protein